MEGFTTIYYCYIVYYYLYGWMDRQSRMAGYMDEGMGEQSRMNGWKGEWVDGQMDGRVDKWLDGWMFFFSIADKNVKLGSKQFALKHYFFFV